MEEVQWRWEDDEERGEGRGTVALRGVDKEGTGAEPLTAGVASTSPCLTALLTSRHRPANTTNCSYTNRHPRDPRDSLLSITCSPFPTTATAAPAGSLDPFVPAATATGGDGGSGGDGGGGGSDTATGGGLATCAMIRDTSGVG